MKKASWHEENGHNGRNQEEKVQNKVIVTRRKQAGMQKMDINRRHQEEKVQNKEIVS